MRTARRQKNRCVRSGYVCACSPARRCLRRLRRRLLPWPLPCRCACRCWFCDRCNLPSTGSAQAQLPLQCHTNAPGRHAKQFLQRQTAQIILAMQAAAVSKRGAEAKALQLRAASAAEQYAALVQRGAYAAAAAVAQQQAAAGGASAPAQQHAPTASAADAAALPPSGKKKAAASRKSGAHGGAAAVSAADLRPGELVWAQVTVRLRSCQQAGTPARCCFIRHRRMPSLH